MNLATMTWPDVEAAVAAGSREAVLAVGAIEQHGPHLPLATDTLIATETARRVADRMPGVLLAPTLPVGVSTHHLGFAGTLSIAEHTFQAQVAACVDTLGRHGIERVFVLSGHGGNYGPLARLERDCGGRIGDADFVPFADLAAFIAVFHGVSDDDGIGAAESGAHAGEWETSIMLALHPDLVHMERAEAGFVAPFDAATADRLFREGTASLAANGVLGDPRSATAERGERHLSAWVDTLVAAFTEET